MNYGLHPRVMKGTRSGMGQIVLALWLRTDPTTRVAEQVSLEELRQLVGWRSRGAVGTTVRLLIKKGHITASRSGNDAATYTWAASAVMVNAPTSRPIMAEIVNESAPHDTGALAPHHTSAQAPHHTSAQAPHHTSAPAPHHTSAPAPHHTSARNAADPSMNSSSYQKKNSPAAAAHEPALIATLRAVAEAEELIGCTPEESKHLLSVLHEVGIDFKQARRVCELAPSEYIRANIAHARKWAKQPGGYLKAVCTDQAGWLIKHLPRWREERRAALAAVPDRRRELDVLTDDDFARLAHQAIAAVHDIAQREKLQAAVAEHGTPRTSLALCDLVLDHLALAARPGVGTEITPRSQYERGITADGKLYTAAATAAA